MTSNGKEDEDRNDNWDHRIVKRLMGVGGFQKFGSHAATCRVPRLWGPGFKNSSWLRTERAMCELADHTDAFKLLPNSRQLLSCMNAQAAKVSGNSSRSKGAKISNKHLSKPPGTYREV